LTTKITTKEPSNELDVAMCEVHNMPIAPKYMAMKKHYCEQCIVELRIKSEDADFKREQERIEQARADRIKRYLENANIPERFKDSTFENYKSTSEEQQDIIKSLKEFIDNPRRDGLIMIGKVGTGKNHLAIATMKEFIKQTEQTALIIKFSKMIREVTDNWITRKLPEEEIISKLTSPYLLVVNEIGVQFGSDKERNLFTEILDDRYEALKPTILIGNVTIGDISDLLGDRVVDRFKEDGQVLVFTWESYRGKGSKEKV
jgi:DNA replication protein DnaC